MASGNSDPGPERAVAADVLEPQRQREQQAELPQADDRGCDVAVAERRNGEQPQVERHDPARRVAAQLDGGKGRQANDARGECHRDR
jgi:hypothetical protein